MPDQDTENAYSVEDAIRAQNALRQLAGLEPEVFPLQAFVGMISDEIEVLRKQGHSDESIAQTISANSKIAVTGDEIAAYYASPEQRGQHHG